MTHRGKFAAIVAAVAVLVAGLVAIWIGATAASPAPKATSENSGPLVSGRWAHPRLESQVFSKPSTDAVVEGRLQLLTEDKFPEVYSVLGQTTSEDGAWVEVGLPERPNGQTGWVPKGALGQIRSSRRLLEIDRGRFVARLWENRPDGERELLWSARIGVGEKDTKTPAGTYWIRERLDRLEPGGVYGPVAFGTSAYSNLSDWPGGGVVGIHGTNEPWLLPGAISHGCVRVTNQQIRELAQLMPIGTPVRIS